MTQERKEEKFLKLLKRNQAPFDYEKQIFNDHYSKVISILNGKHPSPYELEIQPTSACNLGCKHCFGTALTCERLANRMDKKAMKKIAQRVNEFEINGSTIETVKFCGTTGEPLVNPVTVHGIKMFKEIGKKVIIYTNGLWLDVVSEEGKKYMDYILEAYKINLSLDAGSKETFASLKGVDGFDRTIKNLKELAQKRDKTRSKLRIDVSYVIGKQNYTEILKTAQIARDAGANNVIFRVDFAYPETVKPILSEIHEQKEKAIALKTKDFNVWFAYSDEDLESTDKKENNAFYARGKKCFNHHFWACIGPDCNLYVCGHRTYHGVEHFGSVLTKPLKEIWLEKERLEKVKNLPDDNCKFCSPSCHRRDCFMKFLSSLSLPTVEALHEKYITKKEPDKNIGKIYAPAIA